MDYPLMDVLKGERSCPDEKPVPREIADVISRALVVEGTPLPIG